MKLLKANIDGFGKWINVEFNLEGSDLICFYGQNEAGKSTLQQFILYVLFGLPPKKRKAFRPIKGAEIGGFLTVFLPGIGEVISKRHADMFECYLPDGKTENEAWWKEQIKGLSRELYEAVYAFSQQDLQKMRTLYHTEVSDVLFSIALSGSAAIYETEKQLTNQLDTLYKPRGQKPFLNKQINKVNELYKKLQIEKANEAAYVPLNEEIAAQQEKLNQLKTAQSNLQYELIMIETLEQAIPSILEYQTKKERLAAFPDSIPFPQEGMERYEQLKASLLPLKSEQKALESKLEENKKKYNKLKQEIIAEEDLNKAEHLLKENTDYELRLKQLITFEKELDDLKEKQSGILKKLEINFDEWQDITIPFHLEASWEQLTNDLKQHKKALETIQEKQLLLKEKKNNFLSKQQQMKQQLLPEKSLEELEEKLIGHKMRLDNREQKRKLQTWQGKEQKKKKSINYIYAGLAAVTIILGFALNETLLYAAALVFLVAGGINFFFARNQLQLMDAMFTSDFTEQLSEDERIRYQKLLDKQRQLKDDLSYIQKELQRIDLDGLQLEEQKSIQLNREKQLSERIAQEQFSYPFLTDKHVQYWPDLLKYLRELEKMDVEIKYLEEKMSALEKENEELLDQLNSFGNGGHFRDIKVFIDSQQLAKQSIKQYEETIASVNQQLITIKTKIKMYEEEASGLFALAESQNEEDYYCRYDQLKAKKQLTREMETIEQQLRYAFSEEKVHAFLHTEIHQVEVELERQQMKQKLKDIDTDISKTNQRLAELHVTVKQLEQSDDYSSLSLQFEIEKEALNQHAEQWAIIKLADAALKKAKASYQAKYFKDVMKFTSQYFCRITEGKYHSVYPPGENSIFQVEGKNDMRYTVEELSQGTVDQLYVALRLAMAKVMDHYVTMPLLIDDAFVHFDGARTADASKLLNEISGQQQIIFFTCKEEMMHQFHSVKQIESNYIVK